MIYKGKEIDDHCYEWKSQVIESLSENSQSLTLEVIKAWEELIIKKNEELKSNGVDFKDATIGITGDGFHYNPNGADDEPYMNIYLQWQELETDEERDKRIEKKKKSIDQEIEDEKKRAEYEKQQKENELWEAIETIRRNGYRVI